MNDEGRQRWGSQDFLDTVERIIWQVLLRIFLCAVFVTINQYLRPVQRPISKRHLVKYYGRPRRDSLASPCIMAVLGLLAPLLSFTLPTIYNRNYLATIDAVLGWSLALVVNALVTEVLKLSVGSPRPDFLYRCYPDGNFITGQCTGKMSDLMEGRKSFPSGHSSFAFCSLGFLSMWTWSRRWCCGLMWRVVPLATAAAVAVSRVADNHHHGCDVLAGSALGYLIAYICFTLYQPIENHTRQSPNSNIRLTPYCVQENNLA